MLVVNYVHSGESPPQHGRRGSRETVRSRELSGNTVLVSVSAEVDASSAAEICTKIERRTAGYRQMVLDLSEVEFFGTAGYALLHRLHFRCNAEGVNWVLVASPEVNRLLRVCDPDGMLPTATNIVSAVASLARSSQRIAQLRNGLR